MRGYTVRRLRSRDLELRERERENREYSIFVAENNQTNLRQMSRVEFANPFDLGAQAFPFTYMYVYVCYLVIPGEFNIYL